ncbi:SMP-30/gluconolactonase/LRE family protein [Pelagicoccus sp. SDUM812002]|uniref:SMP-30/gluconolactonase/LRE family protein n=1 Tax=Pelagicoccus sp. SDUM812002 TaxID=3041266 RepID=UPI00280F1210|nr:SMP-30/gluconolactonase/LRE family protein [Pelagicoccus sp. SDUM812002]MDQ8186225.1 SMP-30/gluconolactonase/LRE family protein [Pelagicoccus sp. SDUM812002]
MTEVQCVYHDRAQLGEGVFWSERDKKVFWIDIEGHRVCRFDPATGKNDSVFVGQQVGTVVENASGGLVVGLKDGVYALDFETGVSVKWCDPMEGDPDNRLNDGKAGPDGRFYVGGMGPDGGQSLYRIDNNTTEYEVIETGVTCSNGLAWGLDHKTLYYIDSPQRVVWAYDFDLETGTASNRRVVVDVRGEECVPDGMTIDAEGKLWVAFWEGWGVRRYNPDTGELMQEIKLPVARVTTCAFGGEKLDTLYITTASVGFEESDWLREPEAGGLFCCKPGVRGLPSFQFERT